MRLLLLSSIFFSISSVSYGKGSTAARQNQANNSNHIEVKGSSYLSSEYMEEIRQEVEVSYFIPDFAVPEGDQTKLFGADGNFYLCNVSIRNVPQFIPEAACVPLVKKIDEDLSSQIYERSECQRDEVQDLTSNCLSLNLTNTIMGFKSSKIDTHRECLSYFEVMESDAKNIRLTCSMSFVKIEGVCNDSSSSNYQLANQSLASIEPRISEMDVILSQIPPALEACAILGDDPNQTTEVKSRFVNQTGSSSEVSSGSNSSLGSKNFGEYSECMNSDGGIDPSCGKFSGIGDSSPLSSSQESIGVVSKADASLVAQSLDIGADTDEEKIAALAKANVNGSHDAEIIALGGEPEPSEPSESLGENQQDEGSDIESDSSTVAALEGPNLGDLTTVAATGLLTGFLGSMEPQTPSQAKGLLPPPGGLVLPPLVDNKGTVTVRDPNQITSPTNFRDQKTSSRTSNTGANGFDSEELGNSIHTQSGSRNPSSLGNDSQYGAGGSGSSRGGSGGGFGAGSSSLASGGGSSSRARSAPQARSAFGSGDSDDPMFLNKSGSGGRGKGAKSSARSGGSSSGGIGSMSRKIGSLFGSLKNKITGKVDPKFDHQKYIPDLYKTEKITKFSLPEPEELEAHEDAFNKHMGRQPAAMELCLPHENMWEKVSDRYASFCSEGIQVGCRKQI